MEYRLCKEELRTYYSSMSGATSAPWNVIYGEPMKFAPLQKLHYHSVPEIDMCVSGSGEYYINNRIYRFKAGDIQIIRPFVPHYSIADDNTVAQSIIITFDVARAMQLAGMLDPEKTMMMKNVDIPLCGSFAPEEYPELTGIIKKIIEVAKTNDDYTDISVAFSIGEFLIACKKHSMIHTTKAEDEYSESKHFRTAPAINRINLNLSDSAMLSENKLASICGMSVSNFRRIFRLETGTSPKAFIIKSRMSYAEYLLKNTNMTILEISEQVGYNEISGFNKTFTDTFKVSPNRYRKNFKVL